MSEVIDNRAHRIRTLKSIIQRLHGGAPPEEVKSELEEIVKRTDASEVAAMEQELIAEGMAVEEIRSMCDLHSQVLRDILTEKLEAADPPGHPLDTFRRENEALSELIARMRATIVELESMQDDSRPGETLMRLRQAFNELMDIDKHYQRKEYLLFSRLEHHGITGPSQVMWGKDDEVRDLLKALGEALSGESVDAAGSKKLAGEFAEPALAAVQEMIYKEENILFPMSREALTEQDWGEIWKYSPEYGWCLLEPREGYQPPKRAEAPEEAEVPTGQALVFPNGTLTPDQLRGIFASLPIDLTFVDTDDRVRFFSQGPDAPFSRSRAILGRKVHHCHPPKSVDTVENIVSDLRNGRQDVAEFWIDFQGKFLHIRYFAVRDDGGQYLGTLEFTQDLTRLRALEGERRLLQYDSPQELIV